MELRKFTMRSSYFHSAFSEERIRVSTGRSIQATLR